jgi:Lon protease-like protein
VGTLLPLFPLQTVLFPGLLLPVHVFEDRYRAMVRDLLAEPEPRRFGVVAIRAGREVGTDGVRALYQVGCTAQIRRLDRGEDVFDLVTTGVARFRLLQLRHDREYLTADVRLLEERIGADRQVAGRLARRVLASFTGYLEALAAAQGGSIDPPELPSDPLLVSYLVAATVLATVDEKQQLLAAPDAVGRLHAELALLSRERSLLTYLKAPPATELTRTVVHPN